MTIVEQLQPGYNYDCDYNSYGYSLDPALLRPNLFCSLWLRNLSLLCIVIARVRSP